MHFLDDAAVDHDAQPHHAQGILDVGLIQYRSLEKGAPAAYSSGRGNNAENAGTPSEGSMIGKGVRFLGQNPINIPTSESLEWKSGGEMTWSAWIKPAAADGSSRPGRGSGGAHLPAATEPESPGSRNVAGPNRPDRSSSLLELGTSAADPGGQVGAELDGHDPAAPLGQRQRRLAGSRADLQDARTGSDPREVGQVVEQRRRVPRGRARPYSPAAWSNVARSRSGARASLAPPGS